MNQDPTQQELVADAQFARSVASLLALILIVLSLGLGFIAWAAG